MSSSVGSPPGTTYSGACACATACEQRRQAYLGRRVTSTRNWAGITVQPLGHVLPDLRHLTAAAGTLRARGLDHPLDPGQLGRRMPAVTLRSARRLRAHAPQRRFGLLLRGLEHPLGQFGIFQQQGELVGRQFLGTLAELRTLRRARDILKPTVGLLHLGKRRLDLGQAGLQRRVLTGESLSIHGFE